MSESPNNPETSEARPAVRPGLATLRYTTLRLLLRVAWMGIGYALGFRGVMLLIIAFGASGATGLYILRRHRDVMSEGLVAVFAKINKRIDDKSRAEDFD